MLKIPGTYNKPTIEFNTETGVLLIEGTSFTVNSFDFYMPLLNAIAEYKKNPQAQTRIYFKLDYLNTSSSKSILDVLRELELLNENSKVIIYWYYEKADIEMLETGKSYQAIVNLPFCLVGVEPSKASVIRFFKSPQKDKGF